MVIAHDVIIVERLIVDTSGIDTNVYFANSMYFFTRCKVEEAMKLGTRDADMAAAHAA